LTEPATASLPLFIYGTLHPDRAPREIAAVARQLKPLGPATIRGRILDLGEYPGLVLADANDSQPQIVPGELFAVPDLATLAELDRYEDFRANDPEASLFLRVEALAILTDGSRLPCWVYVYNR